MRMTLIMKVTMVASIDSKSTKESISHREFISLS